MRPCLAAALALPLALGLAEPAQAQIQAYCSGRVIAERFTVTGTPGPMGRSLYSVDLRNTRGNPIRIIVSMAGDALGRPLAQPFTVSGHGRLTLPLGYHPRRPGAPPLTPQRLAEATRLTCL
jgi:hypothetical protein